jgi:hypothetical protein
VVDPRLRRFAGPVAAFAVMVGTVMATGAVLFVRKTGLAPSGVRTFYLGSEASFAPPRSLAGLLEVAVPHLLAVPMLLFVTLHLVAFAFRARRRPFAVVSRITWACALAGILSGFGIRWIWPGLAALKIAAFVGLEATMLLWLGLLVAATWPAAAGSGARSPGCLEPSGERR